MRLDRQMNFRAMKDALAFPMRVLTSASLPPCGLITLPRYVKVSTSFTLLSPNCLRWRLDFQELGFGGVNAEADLGGVEG